MLKVFTFFGTRPEAIPTTPAGLRKLALVIRELRRLNPQSVFIR